MTATKRDTTSVITSGTKRREMFERHWFGCECWHTDHVLGLAFLVDDEFDEVIIETGRDDLSCWRRLKFAWEILRYGRVRQAEIILGRETATRLHERLTAFVMGDDEATR